jgi:hypothetical protein
MYLYENHVPAREQKPPDAGSLDIRFLLLLSTTTLIIQDDFMGILFSTAKIRAADH